MSRKVEPYKWLVLPFTILFFAPIVAIGNLGYLPPENPLSWQQFTAFYLTVSAGTGALWALQLYRLAEKYLKLKVWEHLP